MDELINENERDYIRAAVQCGRGSKKYREIHTGIISCYARFGLRVSGLELRLPAQFQHIQALYQSERQCSTSQNRAWKATHENNRSERVFDSPGK